MVSPPWAAARAFSSCWASLTLMVDILRCSPPGQLDAGAAGQAFVSLHVQTLSVLRQIAAAMWAPKGEAVPVKVTSGHPAQTTEFAEQIPRCGRGAPIVALRSEPG